MHGCGSGPPTKEVNLALYWGHVTEGPSLLTYDKLVKRLKTVLLNPKSQPYYKNQALVNEEWVENVAHQKPVNL